MDWNLQYVAFLLVAVGSVFLSGSLGYARFLLRDEHGNPWGWRTLFVFVGLFIIGYVGYGLSLLARPVNAIDLLISAIFFGGGLFVLLVVRMSVHTVQHVNHTMALERHHALHDNLTNLPNRMMLMARINQAIAEAQERNKTVAILILDLNRFKDVNDTLGHHYGDRLLVELSHRLHGPLQANDMVARLGGDEFGFVLEGVTVEQAGDTCRRILEMVDRPFIVEGHSLGIGGSIGIAMYPQHGLERQLLMQHADVAMYEAKRNSKGYAVYEESFDKYSLERLKIIASLRDTVLPEQLSIYYQPKISLKDGRVCGLEALLRWQHPGLGRIPPDDFIPVAERAGVMKQITLWVFKNVLMQIEQWQALGIHLNVSVNLSASNLGDDNLPQHIHEILDAYRVAPSGITMEVTESSMMAHPALAQTILNKLNAFGLLFSIDDFGTGYSSLAYLKSLPASEIKIDKSFVLDMIRDETDAVIVHSTIALAHNMGYRVVAEGVENAETLELLQVLGCDEVQGFYFSEPIEAAGVPAWIRHHDNNCRAYARVV